MPLVAVRSSPNGAPMANTHWPTLRLSASPMATVGKSLASILSNAISDWGSLPITLAGNSRLSFSLTVIFSAPSTTWWLVTR